LSHQISRALIKRGFKFLGATTVYSFFQAGGLVNDHFETCQYK
ncbi:DNA-3-methyladenine glycosylase I, partial [Enterococcus faecalis]